MRRRLIQRRFTRISARRIRLRSGLMLRITVELVPFGDETQAREIAVASIGNVGGSADLGDYAYTPRAEASPLAPAVGHHGTNNGFRSAERAGGKEGVSIGR